MKQDYANLYKNLRVLVVDDHMLMRNMIMQNLRSIGLQQIESAANGKDAWTEITTRAEAGLPYHIIFLDWHMPEMDGISVLKACRADRRFDNTAIVMLTAEQEERNILQAIEAGATTYIVKPVSCDVLEKNVTKVIAWLEKKGVTHMEKAPPPSPAKDAAPSAAPGIPQKLQQELKPFIAKGIENIFSEMFKVKIVTQDQEVPDDSKDLVCIGRLHQHNILIFLRFLFDQELLRPMLQQLYAPQFLKDPKIYEDAACEIVNILCSQIKAFLNGHGYNLQLDFPEMAARANKNRQADSIMDIRFSLNEDQFFLIDVSTDAVRTG